VRDAGLLKVIPRSVCFLTVLTSQGCPPLRLWEGEGVETLTGRKTRNIFAEGLFRIIKKGRESNDRLKSRRRKTSLLVA